MDSTVILRIHTIAVMLFLITYVIKTVLLLSSRQMLDKYASITKVPEMIISFVFLATGIWLYVIVGGIKTFGIIKLVCVFVSIPLAVIGFKKHKKGLALLALFLIIGAYGLAEMGRGKPFIPAPSLASTEGAAIYQANCVFCHGDDGKKMYRNANDLSKSVFPEDAIKQMVLEGSSPASKNKMPAYKLVLTDAQIAAVSNYVVSLRASVDSTGSATNQ